MPIPGLLARLTAHARPRLTWYGGVERVELSGEVFDNWVTKIANFLVEEYAAGPGTRVRIDMPMHWRSVAWAVAVWRVGACITCTPNARPHLVVTDRPAMHSGTPVVAVALPALAHAFDGELPESATDATGVLLGYGDVLTWIPEPDPLAPAIEPGGRAVMHRALGSWAEDVLALRGPVRSGGRVLVEAEDPRTALMDALGVILAVYATDGSVVLRALDGDDDARRRVIQTELVTDTVTLTG
jgi:uncharacterized protein (TIGR03089 family)